MRSKGNAPTAAQKRWRESVRGLGSIFSSGTEGQGIVPAEIHHPVGVTGKHNKIEIGHWWILPLTKDEHGAVHEGYIEDRKEFEKENFKDVCMWLKGHKDMPSTEVIEAIQDYHL